MRHVPRLLADELVRATRSFPAIILTGPRRAGKTTLLQRLFPEASYHLMEDPDVLQRVRTDPRTFLDEVRAPAILDEIQNVPELFAYVRTRIDGHPRRTGQWLLTGSQEAALMHGVTESMAGRAGVLQLLPLSTLESDKVTPFRGGFPEVIARPRSADVWLRSYVQTYLERDVRAVTAVRDLTTFRRFLALVASRCGQLLNKTDLAAPLGVSVPTIGAWLDVLETTGQILVVPPYFENFGKRLVKTPKLYFVDTGLLCSLLGIGSARELERSPFLGAVFESFVASEMAKAALAAGRRRELYWYRDHQGLEVDFLLPAPGGGLMLVEAKATRTPTPDMARAMIRLRAALPAPPAAALLVHRTGRAVPDTETLAPGIRAVGVAGLLERLWPRGRRPRRS
jgi:predicted AAA+ superfamily ATPase